MQLLDLIETTVGGLGYELVEFETSPRARLLRVFIDRPPDRKRRASASRTVLR
jgi:ribosome maturation factor RimP